MISISKSIWLLLILLCIFILIGCGEEGEPQYEPLPSLYWYSSGEKVWRTPSDENIFIFFSKDISSARIEEILRKYRLVPDLPAGVKRTKYFLIVKSEKGASARELIGILKTGVSGIEYVSPLYEDGRYRLYLTHKIGVRSELEIVEILEIGKQFGVCYVETLKLTPPYHVLRINDSLKTVEVALFYDSHSDVEYASPVEGTVGVLGD